VLLLAALLEEHDYLTTTEIAQYLGKPQLY
jgi:hypothetical protein